MNVEAIIFTLISVVFVSGMSIVIMNRFFQNERSKRAFELKQQNASTTLPMRLQAYERTLLYLERINPENLLFRVHKGGMSAKLFQVELLKAIRTEYDHNLTQQLYISTGCWDIVKRCKEEIVKLINMSAAEVGDQASGIDLTRVMLTKYGTLDKKPILLAIDYLKKEVRQLF